MSEQEADIFDKHVAESEGEIVHPDDLAFDANQPESDADDFYASSIAAAEMIDEEYTAKTFGSAFIAVRQALEQAKEVSKAEGLKYVKVFPGDDRDPVSAGHYIGTDVFKMREQGIITPEGYNRLLEEYGTFASKKEAPVYESGQGKYKDWQSAAANDRLEQ